MPSALPTPAPSTTFGDSAPRAPRPRLPIGARFPRYTAEQSAAAERAQTVTITSAPVFPIGARFPRRTPVDAVLYLAELATSGERVASTRRSYPIGARFPLR